MTRTIALALMLIASAAPWPDAATQQPAPAPRVVEVVAQRFDFWPAEIRVRAGETIELRVSSEDTMHGFRIVGGDVNLQVPKRGKGEAVAQFTGRAAGRYTIECNRLCGAGHNFMRATLIVSDEAEAQQ